MKTCKVRAGKIEDFCGDVIVNSIGVDSPRYGMICSSIVFAADSDELRQYINDVNNIYFLGEYFVTDGYKLNSQHIINLITPFYEFDEEFVLYCDCLRRILNECQYHGWKKVGIPLIGTGNDNKYPSLQALDMIVDLCDAYCKEYPQAELDITVIVRKDILVEYKAHKINVFSYNCCLSSFEKAKRGSELLHTYAHDYRNGFSKAYFGYYEQFFKPTKAIISTKELSKLTTIGDYVEEYVRTKWVNNDLDLTPAKIKQKIAYYFAWGKKGTKDVVQAGKDAYGYVKKRNSANKKDLYKIVFGLRMNTQDAEAFLKHFGYCFAFKGVNEVDDAVRELIKKRQYGIVEIQKEFDRKGIKESIFKSKSQ